MPSRTLILVVCALLLVGGVWFAATREKKETVYLTIPEDQAKRAAVILSRDTDKDRLMDWEEELWQTKADNPDTDGDGTVDGEEIRLGRNPLLAGQNDALDRETIEKKTTLTKKAPTATDRFARELFEKYLLAKQTGEPLTAEGKADLVRGFLENPPPIEVIFAPEMEELPVSEDTSTPALRRYGNALIDILARYSAREGENELVILDRSIESEDPKELDALIPRLASYEAAHKELLALTVPKSAAENHRNLLTALAGMIESVRGMQTLWSDSLAALKSIGYYPHAFGLFFDTLEKIADYMRIAEIPFREDEPGSALIKTE